MPITASKGSPYARIEGLGAAVPSRVVDNAEMCTYIDSSDEWIQQRTGIAERRWVGEGETVETMALAAARTAVERAGIDPDAPPGPVDLSHLTTPSETDAKAWRDIWSAGQGVQAITDVPSVARLVDRLEAEYAAALSRLT